MDPTVRPARKATLRLGQHQLTLLSSAVVLFISALLLLAGYRVYRNFKANRDITIAKSNLVALYKAFAGYAEDWDGRLPPADHWTDCIAGYLHAPPNTPGGKMSFITGPGDGATVGYVYNELAAGYNLTPTNRDDRQKKIAPKELIVLIEKEGAERNAHVRLPPYKTSKNESEIYKSLDFPHYADDAEKATTLILFATGRPKQSIRRDFQN